MRLFSENSRITKALFAILAVVSIFAIGGVVFALATEFHAGPPISHGHLGKL